MKSGSSPATSFPAELAPGMEIFIGAKLQRNGAGSRNCEFLRWLPPVKGCRPNRSGHHRSCSEAVSEPLTGEHWADLSVHL